MSSWIQVMPVMFYCFYHMVISNRRKLRAPVWKGFGKPQQAADSTQVQFAFECLLVFIGWVITKRLLMSVFGSSVLRDCLFEKKKLDHSTPQHDPNTTPRSWSDGRRNPCQQFQVCPSGNNYSMTWLYKQTRNNTNCGLWLWWLCLRACLDASCVWDRYRTPWWWREK